MTPELGLAVAGLAIFVGFVVYVARQASGSERTKREQAEGDLAQREKFDETYRKARGGALARAWERLRRDSR